MQTNSSSIGGGVLAAIVIIYVLVMVIAVWANVRIIRRSGYSGWWILIGLVPVVNLVMYLVFAFKEAPTERELKQLRAWASQNRNYGGQNPY